MKNKSILFLAFALISLTAITPDLQGHGGGGGGGYHGGGHGGYGHGGYGRGGYGYGGGAFAGGLVTGAVVGSAVANSGSNQPSTVIVNNEPSQSSQSLQSYCYRFPDAPECH